jgi:hypothetical protein
MIVEFVGAPGAGKTTLTSALLAILEERGIAASDVVGAARDHVRRTRVGHLIARRTPRGLGDLLLWQVFYVLGVVHAIRFGCERPRLVREALRSQLRLALPFRTRAHVLYWFIHLCGRYRFLGATTAEDEVLLLDDGFMHRAVHLFASPFDEPDAGRITTYLDRIPRPDLVVVAVAGWRESEARVRRRGVWKHARRLTDPELSRYLEHAQVVVDVTRRWAKERCLKVIEIPTNRVEAPGINGPPAPTRESVAVTDAHAPRADGGSVV